MNIQLIEFCSCIYFTSSARSDTPVCNFLSIKIIDFRIKFRINGNTIRDIWSKSKKLPGKGLGE